MSSDVCRVLDVASTDTSGRPPAPGAPKRMRQIDALRVLSCLSVVVLHAISGPYPADDPDFGAVSLLLHYSREIFFFVSALVLVRTYAPRLGADSRLPNEAQFRQRRLRLIGVPYLVWTTIYLLLTILHARTFQPTATVVRELPLRWVSMVLTGYGWYHLYFMLVTLQFTVVFPLFLRWLMRTQGRHGRVLAASAVLQAVVLSVYHWVGVPGDGWRMIVGDASLLSYQLWLVAGALAGLHLERMHVWITGHRALILAALPIGAAALVWHYWWQVPRQGVMEASTALQPAIMLWSPIMLGVLYLASVWLARLPSAALGRALDYLAQLSFGLYLAHPLILDVVLKVAGRTGSFAPAPWFVVVCFVLTTGGAVALCAVLHRTRFSRSFLGRAQLHSPLIARPWSAGRSWLVVGATVVMVASAASVVVVGVAQRPDPAPTDDAGQLLTVAGEHPVSVVPAAVR